VRRSGTALVLLSVVLGACAGDDGAAPASEATVPPTTVGPGATSLHDLAVGDCLRGLDEGQDPEVVVLDCEARHQAEVYGVIDVDARRYPGVAALRRQVAPDCAQRFAGYTGEPAGPGLELAFVEIVPSPASWASGDRRALCLALGEGRAPLRGSIAAGGPR
jgi:hypothetical protein